MDGIRTENVFDTPHSGQAKTTETRPATSGGLSSPANLSGSNPNTEEKEDPVSGTSARRIACDICRGRKVRCDRVHPVCGRCSKLGHKCGYTTPRKHDASRVNMSQALLTLQERLAQTEARLASTQQALLTSPPAMPARHPQQSDYFNMHPLSSSSVDTGFGFDLPAMLDFPGSLADQPFDGRHRNGFGYDLDIDTIMGSDKFDFTPELLNNNPYSAEVSSTNTDITNFDEELAPEELRALHQSYFRYIHAVIPMINRRRFCLELEHPHPRPEFMSVNYAIALFGAAASEEAELEDRCYHTARRYLALAERDDEATDFNSLNMLQACILVAYYEFRRTSFARAWMSIGRAIRLCKMLGLHRMDYAGHARTESSESHFFLPLPEARGSIELEERRRTFWVLFTFDAYASVRTGSPMTIQEEEIFTLLPSPGDPSNGDLLSNMPSLANVATIADRNLLTSFDGAILMTLMYRRCHTHFQASRKQDLVNDLYYNFWQHHYKIDKDLTFYSTDLLGHLKPHERLDDPLALCVHMNLCAIKIALHEHAINKTWKQDLPDTLRSESDNRCRAAVVEIAGYNKVTEVLDRSQPALFKRINTFLMWPLCMASQALTRQLKNPKYDESEIAVLLHRIWLTMQAIKDTTGHWEPVIDSIAQELAGLGIVVADAPQVHRGMSLGDYQLDQLLNYTMQ